MGVIARALFLSLRAERSSLKAAEDEIASQAKRRARNDRPKGETASEAKIRPRSDSPWVKSEIASQTKKRARNDYLCVPPQAKQPQGLFFRNKRTKHSVSGSDLFGQASQHRFVDLPG